MMNDKPNPAAAPLCAVWPHPKHRGEENLCVHQVFSTMCTTSSLNQPNACQWGRTPAQLLADWFFFFSAVWKWRSSWRLAALGTCLPSPSFLYVTAVGPGLLLALCSPAARGKGAPHLLASVPWFLCSKEVYVQQGTVFWRPYLREPSACTCLQAGACSLPAQHCPCMDNMAAHHRSKWNPVFQR